MSGTIEFAEGFEQGTNGSAITTANTGYSLITTAASGTITFDSSKAAQGQMSANFTAPNAASASSMYHYFQSSQSNVYARWAIYIPAITPVLSNIGIIATSGSTGAYVQLTATGALSITQSGGAFSATTTHTIPATTWTLIEWNVSSAATTQTLRLYSGIQGSPVETISCSYSLGIPTASALLLQPVAAYNCSVDAFADAFDDWVGIIESGTAAFPWLGA